MLIIFRITAPSQIIVPGDETDLAIRLTQIVVLLRIMAALKSVDEGKDIDEHMDIESVMKYMALQTIVVNFDCMTGHNAQNYYLHEADGKISLIPWDYNLAWGGYPEDEEMEGEDMLEQSEELRLPTNAGMRSKEETCIRRKP